MTINPILSSSARRRMRSVRTPIVITAYGLAVFVFALIMSFGTFGDATVGVYDMRSGIEGYIYMLVFQFILIVLVTPALTAGSIAGERERQTLDLLLVTNTGSLRIVLGKLLESFGYIVLLILSTLPTLCLALLPGGVTLGQILIGMLFLVVSALGALSVGLFCSTLFRRTVTATVVAYLMIFAIGAVTLFPLLLDAERDIAAYDVYTMSGYYPASATAAASAAGANLNGHTPIAFILNPLLGLVFLLVDQTGIMKGTLVSISYTLYTASDYINFGRLAYLSMAFMATASAALILISACLVRPRRFAARRKAKRAV